MNSPRFPTKPISTDIIMNMKLVPAAVVACLVHFCVPSYAEVDFVKDIQPILKESCWDCHADETREAGLRLDQKHAALAGGDTGQVIVPGDPEKSLLLKLISGQDEDRLMPPDDPLSKEQIAKLTEWVKAGAPWPEGVDPKVAAPTHWAYQPLSTNPPPKIPGEKELAPIDAYVRARLEEQGIAPSPRADRHTLMKRLYYDLIGLPPSPEEAEQFISDNSDQAYENLVDRLLASPHFGERWGRHWLDKARYADSDGYEKDRPRHNAWKYRDWVIEAINKDMPFDQFTIEQIAGDLLPDATSDQLLATAFHRQTLTNTEGGTDQEEFRVAAVMDRVETIGSVWLGLTLGCARCHTHKYDRIAQREYYQLFAFFNNGDEVNTNIPSNEDAYAQYLVEKAEFDRELKELQQVVNQQKKELLPRLPEWEADTLAQIQEYEKQAPSEVVMEFAEATSQAGAEIQRRDDGAYLVSGPRPQPDRYQLSQQLAKIAGDETRPLTALKLDALTDTNLPAKGPGRADHGNFVLSEVLVSTTTGESSQNHTFGSATADHSQGEFEVTKAIDGIIDAKGWAVAPQFGKDHHAELVFKEPIRQWDDHTTLRIELAQNYEGSPHTLGCFKLTAVFGDSTKSLGISEELVKILKKPADQRDQKEKDQLAEAFLRKDSDYRKAADAVAAFKKKEPFKPEMTVRVVRERTSNPRQTRVFKRGSFLDPLGPVSPGTLEVLPEMHADDPGRLEFAKWLVSGENPLPPRVVVNQIWGHLFGRAIVKTMNDFGVRGEEPTHPELLDWLARTFIDVGWSRKQLIKMIVMSQTYQQSSAHRSELSTVDPNNRLLYRQNRFRVEAEIIRDLYLASSGLLERRIGGPSVFPPLPPGIAALSYANNFKWGNSDWNSRPDRPHQVTPKDDVHRRGMYTFFKRTAAHPNLITFDCPDSNTTCVDRNASNTPLQALQTLNNSVYMESARALAKRVLAEEQQLDDRIQRVFRFTVSRPPTSDELRITSGLITDSHDYFAQHSDEATDLLAGEKLDGVEPVDLAAWIMLSRTMLNLDEFITRE